MDSIDEWWEDEEFWWRDDPVVRETYLVTLEDGQRLTIFKNTLHGRFCEMKPPCLGAGPPKKFVDNPWTLSVKR